MTVHPMHAAPKCGAKTRSGGACKSPAIQGKKRCRMHGGKSPGVPGNRNAWKHGKRSADYIRKRKESMMLRRAIKDLLEALHPSG